MNKQESKPQHNAIKSHQRQREFLALLRQGNLTLGQAMSSGGVDREWLSRWLIAPSFSRRVKVILRRLRALRHLEADLRSFIVESKLSEAVVIAAPKPIDEPKLKTMSQEPRKRRSRPRRKAEPPCRAHPDVTEEGSEAVKARLASRRETKDSEVRIRDSGKRCPASP